MSHKHNTQSQKMQMASSEPGDLPSIPLSELRRHATPSSVWISIHNQVYDVTPWLPLHPGGPHPLLHLAGSDATDAFLAFHPPSAARHLSRFLIATLSSAPPPSSLSLEYRALLHSLSPLFSIKPNPFPFLSLLFALFVLSLSLVLFTDSTIFHLAAAAVLGGLWIQSGWLGHDSAHSLVMPTKTSNRLAQILSGNCLTGISIAWWKRNHNAHHLACNSLNFDPDLQHIPMFAVSSKLFASLTSSYYDRVMQFDSVARFLVSCQHLTFYPVMCVARLNLFAQSIILLLYGKDVPNRMQEIAGVAVFWVWFPLLVSCLPNWGERAMFVLVSFAVTGIQHVQFCLNHFSSEVYVGPPKGNDWFEKQTAGTLDIVCSPWMDWFHGGLQFQIEHHLFPRMPRCHLRKIAPLVKELCRKHGLKYMSVGFVEANRRTLKVLRDAALQARDLANPRPKNLVWEAVNTHG